MTPKSLVHIVASETTTIKTSATQKKTIISTQYYIGKLRSHLPPVTKLEFAFRITLKERFNQLSRSVEHVSSDKR